MVSDGKTLEYRVPLSMTIRMMLRYFHEVLNGHASRFGRFKLRGVTAQFVAALDVYRLFAQYRGEVPRRELQWPLHNLLDTLLRPSGLGTRPIDCPTDQTIFLWAFLSNGRYRIAKHLSSLMAACKCSFRCTGIHIARVKAQKTDSTMSFYDDLEHGDESGSSDEESSESEEEQESEWPETGDSALTNADALVDILQGLMATGELNALISHLSLIRGHPQTLWILAREMVRPRTQRRTNSLRTRTKSQIR